MAEIQDQNQEQAQQPAARRQTLIGRVVSNKMDKTVVVEVERTIMHRLYQRYMRRSKRFHAHDANNDCKPGDQVVIAACRPMSKTKRWRVQEIVKRAEEQ